MSLDKLVSYITLDKFPFVTGDGSWPPQPKVKRFDYLDTDEKGVRNTHGQIYETFTPTIVEGTISPKFSQLPMWRKIKTNFKGDLPQITYAPFPLLLWKKNGADKFWEPFSLRLPRETTHPNLDTTDRGTGKPLVTPHHEFKIAGGYKTPEEGYHQVSMTHFEPDIPAHFEDFFNRLTDDEKFFAMRYSNISH